ncbi:MAG: hypothetical protein Q4G03_03705 [Planctomycetia bacterium]|nr:hypothetical protein [Planctomycetia bacterium]
MTFNTPEKTVTERRLSASTCVTLSLLLCAVILTSCGCESLENHKCCLFSDEGLFARRRSEVERVGSKEESEAIARATTTSDVRGAWESTDSEEAAARRAGVDMRDYVWPTQRPNGGALFPEKLVARGEQVVMEPHVITAPVGSEVVLVASYIGDDMEYLRVGEELNWSLAGAGRFVEANANENALTSSGLGSRARNSSCLQCNLLKASKEVDSRSLSTVTTGQLWRVNRGTQTTLDDITILRGQSWTSVTSYEEGTTTVDVQSDTINNWDRRRASSTIHWIDAAFLYPSSGVSALKTSVPIVTTVRKTSTSEARSGWYVRYDSLSGDAGFGPNLANSVTVTTDVNGQAQTTLTQRNGVAGTCQLKATIYRPDGSGQSDVAVDSKTFYYTWTDAPPVTLTSYGGKIERVGDVADCWIDVNNLSDFTQLAEVEVQLPKGVTVVSANPSISYAAADSSAFQWKVYVPARHTQKLSFAIRKDVENIAANPSIRLVSASPTDPTGNASPAVAPNPAPAQAPNSMNVNPPTESSTQTAPATRIQNNSPNNGSLGNATPTISPTTDPANMAPSF